MSTPGRAPWTRAGVMALALFSASCIELRTGREVRSDVDATELALREKQAIGILRSNPKGPAQPEPLASPEPPPESSDADALALAEDPRRAVAAPPAVLPVEVPVELPEVSDEGAAGPASEAPPPRQEPASTTGFRTHSLRGRVLSASTEAVSGSAAQLVVFAELIAPENGPEEAHLGALRTSKSTPVAVRGPEGFAPELLVTSTELGVSFENGDEIYHSFFSSTDPNAFEPEEQGPGESRLVELPSIGSVQVYCSLHAGKQLSLVVVPTTDYTLADEEGNFSLDGLLAGTYLLEVWGEGLAPRRMRVAVPSESPEPVLIHVEPEPNASVE